MKGILFALLNEETVESSSESTVDTLNSISINYNSSDYEYLTDYDGYNVISVTTITADETDGEWAANTGLDYDSSNNELIVVQTPDSLPTIRVDRNMNTVNEYTSLSTQGLAYDSTNDRYYQLSTDYIYAKSSDGTLLFSLAFPETQSSPGSIYYSTSFNMFLVTYDSAEYIRFWKPDYTENTLSLDRTIAIAATEGVTMDEDNYHIWINMVDEKRKINMYGSTIFSFGFDLNDTGTVNEGLAYDPTDGTLWFNADEYFHGGITGGNRLWHIDPELKYNKHINIPNQIKWEWGTLTNCIVNSDGVLEKTDTSLTAEWLSPVFDMDGYTDLQSSSVYSLEPSQILSSDTSPTGTAVTIYPFDYYSNWGDTSPSEVELTGILRYAQFKFSF